MRTRSTVRESTMIGKRRDTVTTASTTRAEAGVQGTTPAEFRRRLLEGMAVAIDGEIFQDAYAEKLAPDSEVFLIPKIGGG